MISVAWGLMSIWLASAMVDVWPSAVWPLLWLCGLVTVWGGLIGIVHHVFQEEVQ